MPVDFIIALMYYRFDPTGEEEDNLVWSITAKLKKVHYLSDYAPLNDPNVLIEFHKLLAVVN